MSTVRRRWHWPALLLSASVLLGCSQGACKNAVVFGAPSPDGAFIAFVFHRSCAGSSAVSTHVSIIPFRDSLRNETGNVLVVGDIQPVKISWRSPTQLVVSHFKDPTYQRTQQLDSISVDFHR
jgi:hypothetical protein